MRSKSRLSDAAIASELGVAKSTVGLWLRDQQLTAEEKAAVRSSSAKGSRARRRATKNVVSAPLGSLSISERWPGDKKMRVAEAAVLLRLVVHDIHVYTSPFDGDRVDFVVRTRRGLKKLSVRWARRSKKGGRSQMSIRKSYGRNRFRAMDASDADFFAAFCAHEDAVFVWTARELAARRCVVAVSDDARERWDKLK